MCLFVYGYIYKNRKNKGGYVKIWKSREEYIRI